MRIHARETDRGLAEHGRRKVKLAGIERRRRREVVALLRFRKNVWNVMPLIAPGVHVNWREEDSKRRMVHQTFWQRLRQSKSRCEIARVGIPQPARIAVLSANKNRRRGAYAIREYQVRIRIADVHQWVHILVAQPHLNRGQAGYAEAVLHESICIPLPELHLRNAGLALLHRRKPEKEAGQRRAGPVIRAIVGGVTVGELIIAAILKESPHRPDESPITRAEFQAMPSFLPTEGVARFAYRVPSFHRRGRIVIAHGRITLHVKEWRSKSAVAAKSCALNSELGDDVIGVGILVEPMHRQP